ncbi:hypothetical protein ACFE04_023451 [Oxalis oulophora]
MEITTMIYSFLFTLIILLAFKFLFSRRRVKNLPPSPPALPILGHLHLLKDPLHRTLHTFSQKYGPILSLRFGSRFVLIVSSPAGVEECFNKNDIIFANRPLMTIGDYLGYNHTTISLAPYGDHWRNLRRLCALDIFSSNRLKMSTCVRIDEIKMMLQKLYKISSEEFAKVNVKSMFSELTFNVITRMIAGKRYYGEDVSELKEAERFRKIIEETFEVSGAAFPGDFLPIFKWFDFTGNLKRMKRLGKETDPLMQGLIDDQRKNKDDLEGSNSMISHLLSLQESQPEYYTDEIIKGLVQVMIMAGTDTSTSTLEWAMANLLKHPYILRKVREELDSQLNQRKLIEEQDLYNLPYLQNIVSETLRLYPAGPLLLPHRSSSECTVGGYDIPRDAMLLVNAWAIHRDPKYWDDATSFKPERFESLNIREGEAYKFLPFGVGRRACPGASLANRMVGLALGSLIQCFDWERVNDKEIDMAETNGLSMYKAEPLEVRCKARSFLSNAFLDS